MNHPAPAELGIDRQALTVLQRVLLVAAPEEGCALLLGTHEPCRIRWIWPCLNVWEPATERRRRFALDPREQLQAQKWARRRGLAVLGSAHSHPASAAVPSPTDLALAFPPTLLLILGQDSPTPAPEDPAGGRELACWWLPQDGEPRRLVWRMEP